MKISDTLVEELGHNGFNIIWKRDGIWKEMEMDEIKSHVRKNLRDCKKPQSKLKRKGLETATRRKLKQERERLSLRRMVRRKLKGKDKATVQNYEERGDDIVEPCKASGEQ